ncbi:EamA family transporter [Pelagicoccus sp. SDUM812003]|uniref:EamA family transporter n=1 Tax=Pelagicoccus sp. SDUM812003 TaxID=3041267 RepID=UPI00280D9A5D|nr:EamA family transporter [Pelagicoccus sp. SDUM812003]MDQ8202446.1 EamA family transporter [Pelagicoccus sp. SDUM812003]
MPFLIAVSFIWAFSFGIIGSRLSGLDSTFVATARLSIAWLCFAPFFRLAGLGRGDLIALVGIGSLQFGAMYVAYIRAFAFLPSHLVALFSVLTPLYIALAYDLMRRRWQWSLIACALLSVAGAAVIKFSQPSGDIWAGFALMQVANLSFGLGQLMYREWRLKRPGINDSQVMAALYAGGAAFAGFAFLIWGDWRTIAPSGEQALAILYLGAVASGLGFYLWNKGAARSSAGALAAANNAVVPLAMAASLFLFGESSAIAAASVSKLLAGAALIFGAMLWGQRIGRVTR